MKKKKKLIIYSLVAIAAIVGIMKYHSRSTGSQDNEVWVQASTVKESTLPLEVTAIGTLTARSVEITVAT